MLTFSDLVDALKARGLTRREGGEATGFDLPTDEALEKFVRWNPDMTAEEAANQLAQCLGEAGEPLLGYTNQSINKAAKAA